MTFDADYQPRQDSEPYEGHPAAGVSLSVRQFTRNPFRKLKLRAFHSHIELETADWDKVRGRSIIRVRFRSGRDRLE